MTTAARSEQVPEDAERPVLGNAPGLAVLPGLDGVDVGLCVDGVCRLPGATG